MLRKRITARSKQDEIYPVTMTGPDSFMLDGQEYTGKPSVAGKRFSADERAFVGFAAIGRRQAVILTGATRQSNQKNTPFGIVVNVTDWLQSNQGVGQNALGGLVAAGLYAQDPPAVTAWNLPTSEDSEVLNTALKPYGLVLYRASGTPYYGTMWPQQQESDGAIQVCAGVWDAGTKSNVWLNKEGAYYVPAASFENQAFPSYNLFYTEVGGWLHMVPTTYFSSGYQAQSIYSSRQALGYVAKTGGLGLQQHNASIHGFVTGTGEEATNTIYCFMPYFDEGPAVGAEVSFVKFDEGSAAWAVDATRTVADLPASGSSAVPNLLGTGNANATGSPAAWLNNEALIFVSGGTQALLYTDRWIDEEWTLRSLNPADGTNGAFVKSQAFTATDSPTVLDPGAMIAAVDAREQPLYYVDEGTAIGGILHSDTTSAELEYFPRAVPLILPVALPNWGRLGTIESRLASDSLNNAQWPAVLENSGGGVVVDEARTVWVCTLEPAQVLYGGEYSLEDTGTTQPTYRLDTSTQVTGQSAVTGTIYVFEDPTEVTLGSHVVSVGTGSPFGPAYDTGTLPGDPPGTDPYVIFTYSASLTAVTDWPLYSWKWNLFMGCKWVTMLRGYRANGTVVAQNISQLVDATNTKTLGKPADESVTVTQVDFELADNVHQIISFADKNLLAVLRDLHADGPDGNPSPAIEIYSVGSTSLTKRSTVRLGSYTETLSVDATLGAYETKAGDQEWDPYYFGPPRMKACRKADSDNVPVIVAMVGERKKVDPDTQSQFKRVCYATIELTDPDSPDVTRSARTSEDLGVGSSGYPTGSDYYAPIWDSWDTLVLTPDHVAWIKDSEFRETTAP